MSQTYQMQKAFFLLLTICLFLSAIGQPFEGEIIYHNVIKSKIPNVTDEQLSMALGTTQEYYIKNGNYKSVTNGKVVQWQLYVNADNKLYLKMANSDTLLWNDARANPDEVLGSELKKGVAEILGYTCDEVILTCKSGTQKYYFSQKLPVDPKLFVNHKYANWYDFLSRSKALPLKIEMESEQYTLESEATSVKPMHLDDKLFQLAPDAKTQKNPYLSK
jgi:hypothetical protein